MNVSEKYVSEFIGSRVRWKNPETGRFNSGVVVALQPLLMLQDGLMPDILIKKSNKFFYKPISDCDVVSKGAEGL